jgi:hypothetical protein
MDGKPCKKCGVTKPLTEFYREVTAKDGHRGECKACFSLASKARYPARRELMIQRAQRWREENPERFRATQKARRQRPEAKAKEREAHLLRKFGITQAQYDEMLAQQGGGCALCGRPPAPGISLHVDHDHVTGKVRGLLCFRHNNALGDFDDDPAMLMKAAGYLDLLSADPAVLAAVRARVAALPRLAKR